MTLIKRSAIVSYSPEQMYDLVNNIEEYSQFLPWCKATVIHSREPHEVKASIHLAKGGMTHTFSTVNRLQPHKMIEVRLLEGPFKHLEGFWRFDETEDQGCKVSFDLEFVFANRMMDIMVGPVLQSVANTFVDAFCERAKEIYGTNL